jgi:hypothetical protein
VLRGRFDPGGATVAEEPQSRTAVALRPLAGGAIALLVVGVGLTLFTEGVLLAIGVLAMGAFVVVGAVELLQPKVLDPDR